MLMLPEEEVELESPLEWQHLEEVRFIFLPFSYFLSPLTDTLLEERRRCSTQSEENGAQRAVLFFTVNLY